tara:strand:+ start:244 stop:363 length:120 start_codon:yes stop_codon:yes gene_type:complete
MHLEELTQDEKQALDFSFNPSFYMDASGSGGKFVEIARG